MNELIIDEGNLQFDFTLCGKPIKFDMPGTGNSGLYAVDFVVDKEKCLLFIEVKDYQNPNTTSEERKESLEMLLSAGVLDKSIFALEMGVKIKDSLLRIYAEGGTFTKKVQYLLFINFDVLDAEQRQHLFDKIRVQIPTGLNNSSRFPKFTEIKFRLVDSAKLKKKYGITVNASNQPMEGVGNDE